MVERRQTKATKNVSLHSVSNSKRRIGPGRFIIKSTRSRGAENGSMKIEEKQQNDEDSQLQPLSYITNGIYKLLYLSNIIYQIV